MFPKDVVLYMHRWLRIDHITRDALARRILRYVFTYFGDISNHVGKDLFDSLTWFHSMESAVAQVISIINESSGTPNTLNTLDMSKLIEKLATCPENKVKEAKRCFRIIDCICHRMLHATRRTRGRISCRICAQDILFIQQRYPNSESAKNIRRVCFEMNENEATIQQFSSHITGHPLISSYLAFSSARQYIDTLTCIRRAIRIGIADEWDTSNGLFAEAMFHHEQYNAFINATLTSVDAALDQSNQCIPPMACLLIKGYPEARCCMRINETSPRLLPRKKFQEILFTLKNFNLDSMQRNQDKMHCCIHRRYRELDYRLADLKNNLLEIIAIIERLKLPRFHGSIENKNSVVLPNLIDVNDSLARYVRINDYGTIWFQKAPLVIDVLIAHFGHVETNRMIEKLIVTPDMKDMRLTRRLSVDALQTYTRCRRFLRCMCRLLSYHLKANSPKMCAVVKWCQLFAPDISKTNNLLQVLKYHLREIPREHSC